MVLGTSSVGALIIELLFMILIGPVLTDVSAYKDRIEARLVEMTGQPIIIGGEFRISLLPFAEIQIGDVSIRTPGGSDGREQSWTASRVRMRISLTALLRGELKFKTLDIDDLVIRTVWRGDGTWHVPLSSENVVLVTDTSNWLRNVMFETVRIRDGTIVIRDPEENDHYVLSGFSLDGKADFARGRYRADGNIVFEGQNRIFSFDAVRHRSNDPLKVKFTLSSVADNYRLTGRGEIALSEGLPSFLGHIGLLGGEDVYLRSSDLRVDADVMATPAEITLNNVSLSFKKRKGIIDVDGSISVNLKGEVGVKADLHVDRLNLDRSLISIVGQRVQGTKILTGSDQAAHWISRLPMALGLNLTVKNAIINDRLIENVAIDVYGGLGRFKASASIDLPGKSSLTLNSVLGIKNDVPVFLTNFSLMMHNITTLADWSGFVLVRSGSVDSKFANSAITVNGSIRADGNTVAFDDFIINTDDGKIEGSATLREDGERLLTVNLNIDHLDLDRYITVNEIRMFAINSVSLLKLKQIDLLLHASFLQFSGIEARDLNMNVVLLKSTSADDVSDAMDNRGNPFDLAEGEISVALKVQKLDDIAYVVRNMGLSKKLVKILLGGQKQAASRAILNVDFSVKRILKGRSAQIVTLAISDDTQSRFDMSFEGDISDIAGGHLNINARLVNLNSWRLMGQSGWMLPTTLPIDFKFFSMSDEINIMLDGVLQAGAEFKITADMLNGTGMTDGIIQWLPHKRVLAYQGEVSLRSLDINPLLYPYDMPGKNEILPLPMSIQMKVNIQDDEWRFDDIKGDIAGNVLSGKLVQKYPVGMTKVHLSGELDFERIDMEELFLLFAGEDLSREEHILSHDLSWINEQFHSDSLKKYLGIIELSSRQLFVPHISNFDDAKLKLSMMEEGISLSGVADLYGGQCMVDILHHPMRSSLQVSLGIKNVPLEQIVWITNETPVMTGILTATMNAYGKGNNWPDWMDTLKGTGTLSIKDGTFHGLNLEEMQQIIFTPDSERDLDKNSIINALNSSSISGNIQYKQRVDGLFSIDGGVVAVDEIKIDQNGVSMCVSGSIDLLRDHLDSEWLWSFSGQDSLVVEKNICLAPLITMTFSGPSHHPDSMLDVDALVDFLTMQRIQHDIKKKDRGTIQNEIDSAAVKDYTGPADR